MTPPNLEISPSMLRAIMNAPKHCYLIAMVDRVTGKVDDVITASEFPVEQSGMQIKQKLFAKTQGHGYQAAENRMFELVSIRNPRLGHYLMRRP